jgi:hypothetical protein
MAGPCFWRSRDIGDGIMLMLPRDEQSLSSLTRSDMD